MNEAVSYTVSRRVAWLTIERPEARNALNEAVRQGLWEGFRLFNADDAAAVLVIAGRGSSFCAGADLKEMAERGLEVPPPDFLPQPGRNLEVAKPTIAAVQGAAYAGGFFLAQSCDLCLAAEDARFAISEVKVGRGTPWALPLPWLIPPRVALQLLLTGDPLDAARAKEVGLVNDVVPREALERSAQDLAERIATNAPLSVKAAKATVRRAARALVDDLYDEVDALWDPVYRSADAQEGPRAFAEKRPPRWQGR